MTDSINVKCSYCGRDLGSVTYVPGRQIIGCYCGARTEVYISHSGDVHIRHAGGGDPDKREKR